MSAQMNDVHVSWLDENSKKTLPVFLIKLIRMLEDADLDDLIRWDRSGLSFHIINSAGFCDNVLPHYFKHRNLNSFVRQLNFYGFRKLAAADKATLTQIENSSDDLHFLHPKFIRGLPQQMYGIKRQTNPTKKLTAVSSDKVLPVTSETQFVSIPQEEWTETNNKLNELQYTVENMDKSQHLLFDEIRILREMCKKQSDCFNKLMSYLINMMNPAKNIRTRRPQRPYVDHASENFMIATRNSGDMLACIQKEFQEGLHISKQSVFDEANKNVQFEYYEPEYYENGQTFDLLQPQESPILPPSLEKQNNQVALPLRKQMCAYVPHTPKKEIKASHFTEPQPSTSYIIPDEPYTYYEQPPAEFLEQQTPPGPGQSPLYHNKIQNANDDIQYVENDGQEEEEMTHADLMDFLAEAPFDEYLNSDEQEWPESALPQV